MSEATSVVVWHHHEDRDLAKVLLGALFHAGQESEARLIVQGGATADIALPDTAQDWLDANQDPTCHFVLLITNEWDSYTNTWSRYHAWLDKVHRINKLCRGICISVDMVTDPELRRFMSVDFRGKSPKLSWQPLSDYLSNARAIINELADINDSAVTLFPSTPRQGDMLPTIADAPEALNFPEATKSFIPGNPSPDGHAGIFAVKQVLSHIQRPPTETGPTTAITVFISYSRHDVVYAKRLASALKTQGFGVWLDKENLTPGTPDWERAIRVGIARSDAVVYLASPEGYESLYVRSELSIARHRKLTIFPIWLRGDEWLDCAPMFLTYSQYVNGHGDRFEQAVREIAAELSKITPKNEGTA